MRKLIITGAAAAIAAAGIGLAAAAGRGRVGGADLPGLLQFAGLGPRLEHLTEW